MAAAPGAYRTATRRVGADGVRAGVTTTAIDNTLLVTGGRAIRHVAITVPNAVVRDSAAPLWSGAIAHTRVTICEACAEAGPLRPLTAPAAVFARST
ncbi:MAG: hypothetical protein ACYCT1_10035 [Steroidobacteraceae bacterium]